MYIVTRQSNGSLVNADEASLLRYLDNARAVARKRTEETGENHFVFEVGLKLAISYKKALVQEIVH